MTSSAISVVSSLISVSSCRSLRMRCLATRAWGVVSRQQQFHGLVEALAGSEAGNVLVVAGSELSPGRRGAGWPGRCGLLPVHGGMRPAHAGLRCPPKTSAGRACCLRERPWRSPKRRPGRFWSGCGPGAEGWAVNCGGTSRMSRPAAIAATAAGRPKVPDPSTATLAALVV